MCTLEVNQNSILHLVSQTGVSETKFLKSVATPTALWWTHCGCEMEREWCGIFVVRQSHGDTYSAESLWRGCWWFTFGVSCLSVFRRGVSVREWVKEFFGYLIWINENWGCGANEMGWEVNYSSQKHTLTDQNKTGPIVLALKRCDIIGLLVNLA